MVLGSSKGEQVLRIFDIGLELSPPSTEKTEIMLIGSQSRLDSRTVDILPSGYHQSGTWRLKHLQQSLK